MRRGVVELQQGRVPVHGAKPAAPAPGNARQPLATVGNLALPLAFGANRPPRDADPRVVRQIRSPAHAVEVSIRAGKHKLDFIGACIGKSRGYVSRLQTGKRPIPDALVEPLCWATGSNLLKQYLALERALRASPEDLTEALAQELRKAA